MLGGFEMAGFLMVVALACAGRADLSVLRMPPNPGIGDFEVRLLRTGTSLAMVLAVTAFSVLDLVTFSTADLSTFFRTSTDVARFRRLSNAESTSFSVCNFLACEEVAVLLDGVRERFRMLLVGLESSSEDDRSKIDLDSGFEGGWALLERALLGS
jgi:hypothetical protein